MSRPTKFKTTFSRQAKALAVLGATDKQMAGFCGVSESTINLWKQKHPKFSESLKEGKREADNRVVQALFQRAIGYSHPEDDIRVCDNHIVITPTTKHYPPDTTACIFWLKNRRQAEWRDRHEFQGEDSAPQIVIMHSEIDPELITGGPPDASRTDGSG